MDAITSRAKAMFEAYNAQGPNPNKTWDGKDVPPWEQLGDQVQGKWLAAARAAPHHTNLLEIAQASAGPATAIPGGPPTVGRIVHFAEDGGPYPAIITSVNPDNSVQLATFGNRSVYFQHMVKFDADAARGTWRWPPRV